MDLPLNVFNWLVKLGVMQEGYIAPKAAVASAMNGTLKRGATALNSTATVSVLKKSNNVTLTQQAANAVQSGHAFYYLCYNISFAQGYHFTSQTLVGNPGDEVSPQVSLYNWQILSDVFGILGFALPTEYRDLIVQGDNKLIVELLKDLYVKYSGEASEEALAKRWANHHHSPDPNNVTSASLTQTSLTPVKPAGKSVGWSSGAVLTPIPRREGAASVDSGLKAKQEAKAAKAQRLALSGVEQSRARFLQKLEREREAARLKEEQEQRAEELRMRMTANFDYVRYKIPANADETLSAHPVFMEFQNRGAVNYCLKVIEEIVDRIESGEAQQELAEKEAARLAARRAAKERKTRGERLVDARNPVHLPPDANHKIGMMIASIVREEIVELAMRPDVTEELAKRAEQRRQERECISSMLTRLERSMAKVKKSPKYEEALAEKKRREAEEAARHDKRMERLRKQNQEEALIIMERSKMHETEKKQATALDIEKQKRKEAELTLYLAEQKAKVIERRRERELQKAQELEKKKQDEEAARAERRRLGIELNRKLQLKEQQRLAALGRNAGDVPVTLTAFNQGTGDHAAYFGDTLGWQYLTEAEFDLAQMICQVRSDPPSLVPCLEQQLATMNGRTIYFTDERGKRHPCVLGEGRPALLAAVDFLNKAKSAKPLDDISIGLTLAARQHAIDLAYHGKCMVEHTGSDGSTLTQRCLRYGTTALRTGCVECVTCIVRPAMLRQGPVDVLSRLLVSDNDPTRASRNAIFTGEMYESCGIGHAIADFEGLIVEAYVVILSFGFIDKPVAQMAAAHHTGIRAVAAPYLDGMRRVHESMADRRKLMSSQNLVIGRLVEANPDFEQLHSEKLRRSKYATVGPDVSAISRRSRSPASVYDDEGDEGDDAPPPQPKQRTAAEEAVYQERKKRVSRIYRRYAPAKLHIVDDALQVFDGRFDDLITLLQNKYGAEPPPTPPPAAVHAEPSQQPAQRSPRPDPSPRASPKALSPTSPKRTTSQTAAAAPSGTTAAEAGSKEQDATVPTSPPKEGTTTATATASPPAAAKAKDPPGSAAASTSERPQSTTAAAAAAPSA